MGRHRRPTENFQFNEADDRIADIFRHHGFSSFDHGKRQQLTQFYFLLMENQKSQNFTRLIRLRDVAIKHYIDCLIVTQLSEIKGPLLDIGSGPGFPGIPVKIALPETRVILAEGVQSRVSFLKHVREKLALKGLDIIGRNIDQGFAYPVNSVITRAVEDIGNTLKKSASCLSVGGRVYFMKGPNVDPEIATAAREWGKIFKLVEDHDYELPNTPHKRRLVVYEKIAQQPQKGTQEL